MLSKFHFHDTIILGCTHLLTRALMHMSISSPPTHHSPSPASPYTRRPYPQSWVGLKLNISGGYEGDKYLCLFAGRRKSSIASDRFEATLIPQLSQHCTGCQSAACVHSVGYIEYHHSWGTVDIWEALPTSTSLTSVHSISSLSLVLPF